MTTILSAPPHAMRFEDGLEFTVPGPAVGKQRMAVNLSTGRRFREGKTDEYMKLVRDLARRVAPPEPWGGAVALTIIAAWEPGIRPYTDIPRSAIGSETTYPTQPPDCDNISKAIADALKGLVWVDDRLVARLRVDKVFGERSETLVRVKRLTDEPTQVVLLPLGPRRRRRRK